MILHDLGDTGGLSTAERPSVAARGTTAFGICKGASGTLACLRTTERLHDDGASCFRHAVGRHQIALNSICDIEIDLKNPYRCCGLAPNRASAPIRRKSPGPEDRGSGSCTIGFALLRTSRSSLGIPRCWASTYAGSFRPLKTHNHVL